MDTARLREWFRSWLAIPGEESPGEHPGPPLSRREAWVETATLLCIFLPLLVFLFGWLHFYLAAILAVLLGIGLYPDIVRLGRALTSRQSAEPPLDAASRWKTAGAVLLVLLTTLAAGSGGYSFQFFDYAAMDAISSDMVKTPFPFGYDIPGSDDDLCCVYYLSHFLLPVLIGKAAGWAACCRVFLLWDALCILLALYWFIRLTGRFRFFFVFCLFVFWRPGYCGPSGHQFQRAAGFPFTIISAAFTGGVSGEAGWTIGAPRLRFPKAPESCMAFFSNFTV